MEENRLNCADYEALKEQYFSGWKTWNVNSVLSWVHMPVNSDKFYHWGALLSVIALMEREFL